MNKAELDKLRTESKTLKNRLKQETEAPRTWQELSKKKDIDMLTYKNKVIDLAKEVQEEKEAH